jgi:hypothetical protein
MAAIIVCWRENWLIQMANLAGTGLWLSSADQLSANAKNAGTDKNRFIKTLDA